MQQAPPLRGCSSRTAPSSSRFPRYPEIKAAFGLSNASLGSAIAAFPLGALLVGLLAAPLIARYRSARVAVGGVGIAVAVPSAPTTLKGNAIAGLGLATLVPAAMDTADNAVADPSCGHNE